MDERKWKLNDVCFESEDFSRLINKHGFYYELGHAWSLSLYEV